MRLRTRYPRASSPACALGFCAEAQPLSCVAFTTRTPSPLPPQRTSSWQVVLRWAVQRGTVPLPRSSTPSRVAENFGLFDWVLSPAQMAALAALDATPNSGGRIMKGDHLVAAGGDWHDVWDEAFLAEWASKRAAAQ